MACDGGEADVDRRSTQVASTFFPEIGAGGFSRLDTTIEFYQRVNSLLSPESTLLDFGAGRGVGHLDDPLDYRRNLRNFRARVRKVVGVDVDPAVLKNPSVDAAFVIEADGRIPLADESVDVIVSDFVLEHLERPEAAAAELSWVLKPGGWLCARTTNRRGYIALANRLIRRSFKDRILHWVQPERKNEDVFLAHYRLNTRATVAKHFPSQMFEQYVWFRDAEPGYHANSYGLFYLMMNLHRFTPEAMKNFMFIFLHKRPNASTPA